MSNEKVQLAPNAEWVHESSAEVQIKEITGHEDSINNLKLINNDQTIFTVSNDRSVRLWDFNTGKQLHKFANLHETQIPCAQVTADYTKFVTCGWDRHVKCWDMETGKLLVIRENPHFDFINNSLKDLAIYKWKNTHEYFVTTCDISNENNMVSSVSDLDFIVKIWDSKSGKLITNIPDLHKSTLTTCKFSPKSERIVTTSMDKTCKFYDLIAKQTTITLSSHESAISNCAFSPDERNFATCSWDKSVLVWDIATGMYRRNGPISLSKAHDGSVSSCFISNDGELCVSSGYDMRIVLWDIEHATPKLILRGHSDWINDVAMTKDNKWIVSVGKDKAIREWYIENYENIKLVVEKNKTFGNKLIQCSVCNRSFMSSKLVKTDEYKMHCVYCRINDRFLKKKANKLGRSSISLSDPSATNM